MRTEREAGIADGVDGAPQQVDHNYITGIGVAGIIDFGLKCRNRARGVIDGYYRFTARLFDECHVRHRVERAHSALLCIGCSGQQSKSHCQNRNAS